MSRGLTAAYLTAADAGTVYPALLAHFDFSGGDVDVWSGIGDLYHNGVTWAGVGNFGGVSAVEESNETQATGVQFSLNGVPSAFVSAILSENYRNRNCALYLALFSSLTATSPVTAALIFSGVMDQAILEDNGDSATITMTAESRLVDLQRARFRRYTDEDQRGHSYTADVGLEYVAGLQDKELFWGQSGNNATPSAGSSGTFIKTHRGLMPV